MNRHEEIVYNEILELHLPVDIVYTNENGEFCFALSAHGSSERYNSFCMGIKQTLKEARDLAEALRLPVLAVFYPYGKPQGLAR